MPTSLVIHYIPHPELSPKAEFIVPEFKKLLTKYGIDKPIWVTEAQYEMGEIPGVGYVSSEEHAQTFVKSYIVAFACGADKVFYDAFRALPPNPPQVKRAALIGENGEIRPAYYALKTLIQKLDKFTSAEKLAEGQYKFIVEGKVIYVLWGASEIPEEITGEILVTDIYERETRTNSSAISLTERPIFIESAAIPATSATHIPHEILASHFGVPFLQDSGEITKRGMWDRPHPGPFIWGQIEPEKGKYSWGEADRYVEEVQSHNIGTLATIWPFAEWDQANWGPAGTTPLPIEEEGLCRSRHKPYDMDAYKRFVSFLVERYDGDGKDDMPGLKYPIKYWEVSNEPSLQNFFTGSSEDYLEVLKATYKAVKGADLEAKVLHAGMAGIEPARVSFWKLIFKEGSSYFDIVNVHCNGLSAELIVP